MDLLCRLCGIKTDVLHPIHIGKTERMIDECYSIQISNNDGLPKMICPKCFAKLELSYYFRLQIFRVQEELQNLLQQESQEDLLLQPIKQELNDDEYIIKDENYTQEESEDDYISVKSEASWHRSSNSESSEVEEDLSDVEEKSPRKVRKKVVVIKEKVIKVKTKSNKENELKIVCSICGLILKKTSLRLHIANVHGDNRVVCDICGKSCNKSALQKHKKTHSARIISCKECGKQLASRQTLYMHMRTIHLGIKNMKCKICEKVFPRNSALKRHMRVHTGETPYVCNYCDRGFNNRWNLTQHIRLHTNEKPYNCKICQESFAQNVVLKLHIKNKHST